MFYGFVLIIMLLMLWSLIAVDTQTRKTCPGVTMTQSFVRRLCDLGGGQCTEQVPMIIAVIVFDTKSV